MKTFLKFFLIIVMIAAIFAAIHFIPQNSGSAGDGSSPSENTDTSAAVSNGIIINEVMSNNKGLYPDDRGNNSDWAEIYNSTDSDVSLHNYTLSDNIKNPEKWLFPDIILKAHGYLIVFLSGDNNSDLQNGFIHCSFKLSSKGEPLLLTNDGVLIDSVDIPSLDANVSYGLENGKWQVMSSPTPGYENSDAGASAFKASRTVQNPSVLITEVMPKNNMTIKDAQGNYPDWVELMNTSGKDVDLNGYGLSDDPGNPMKWKFPDVTIKAGGFITVFCNGNETADNAEGEIDASFKLSSTSSTVTLSDTAGRLMDTVQVSGLSSDWSYERTFVNGAPTSTWQAASQPSPGYPNTSDGFAEFMKNNPLTLGNIVISEVLTSNNNSSAAQGYDYIEVENRGQSAVDLKGYGLTNNAANPAKFLFPDVTLQPGKQLLVLATGLNADQSKGLKNLSAPFKLSRLGDNVSLFNASGQLLDRYFIGVMQKNFSIGRQEGQTDLAYFDTPTPGQANGSGYAGIAQDVSFSQQAGKYASAIQVSLSSSDGSDIYYTTKDGITPSESSTKYTGPITVSSTTVIRAKAFKSGFIPSGTSTSTYFIGTQHTLPVVSITTDYDGLFNSATGIYANSKKYTEVPASFELCDESGKRVFQQNIGLDMTGGLTLSARDQKSFAIYARSKYGKSRMAYKFFDNRNYTEYKSLILRSAARDPSNTNMCNYVALGLVDGQKMNVLTQAAKPCVVYIDGEYWGVYYLMEKRSKYMVAQYEGVTGKKAIDSINLAKGLTIVNNGSSEGYKEIYNYINSHDMSLQENYDWLAARLDTDSFMDFMINEIYIANNDMGNIQFYQIPPNGLWKQIYQDLDISFYNSSSSDVTAKREDPNTPASTIFNALLKNKVWQERFITRFAWALKNIYNTNRVTAAINAAAGLIRGEVAATHERFSDPKTGYPTPADWEAGVKSMLNFAKKRPAQIVKELEQHFTLTDEEKQLLDDAIK